MDYYTYEVAAALQLTYLPDNMLAGAIVEDETNAFDGTIAWGCNQDLTIVYGEMETFEDTDAVASGLEGFEMATSPLPENWFAYGSGASRLPFYESFNDVATNMGMPVQTVYFWLIIGLAFGVALFIIVFTRSALFGVLGMAMVLFIGSSMTIIPMWIPFVILVVDFGIMYLYRQVSY